MNKLHVLLALCVCTTLVGSTFNRVPIGTLKGARLSWLSSNSVVVHAGYGDIGGRYWELPASDPYATAGYTLTGLQSTTAGYYEFIYIDGVTSPIPDIVLKHSTVAPTYSEDRLGWYNGEDRCIGKLYIDQNGNIPPFSSTPNDDITSPTSGAATYEAAYSSSNPLTSNVVQNVLTRNLTAGTYDIQGQVYFQKQAPTSISALWVGISTTAGEMPIQGYGAQSQSTGAIVGNGIDGSLLTPVVRLVVTVPTTVYLVAKGNFSSSTLYAYGNWRIVRIN